MTELYDHQKKAVNFIKGIGGSGALFMEIGTGKTLTALALYQEMKAKKLLVICPISLINAAWGEDIKKFTNLTYCNLRKEKKEADVYIINYESYALKRYQRLINEISPEMVVLDESSKIRNPKAKITKTLLFNKTNFKYRIIMSGTPAPNSGEEFWAQMKFCSNCLPDSFYKFRNLFMRLDRNGYDPGFVSPRVIGDMYKRGFKYVLRDKEAFMQKINPYIFWAKKVECLDLPDTVEVIREVELTPLQLKTYKDMKRNMIAEINKELIVVNLALTKIMKLRQITSGFAIDAHGEAQELKDHSKLKELLSLLGEIGNKQVIIWLQFHKEFEMLKRHLKNYTTLYSETKDRDQCIQDFKQGKVQYLLAHPKSGGHGLTFTNCDTMVFFSIDYSFEGIDQAKGRIHRPGQKNKCTYIYILAKDTIDQDIKIAIEKKENLQTLFKRITNTDKIP